MLQAVGGVKMLQGHGQGVGAMAVVLVLLTRRVARSGLPIKERPGRIGYCDRKSQNCDGAKALCLLWQM